LLDVSPDVRPEPEYSAVNLVMLRFEPGAARESEFRRVGVKKYHCSNCKSQQYLGPQRANALQCGKSGRNWIRLGPTACKPVRDHLPRRLLRRKLPHRFLLRQCLRRQQRKRVGPVIKRNPSLRNLTRNLVNNLMRGRSPLLPRHQPTDLMNIVLSTRPNCTQCKKSLITHAPMQPGQKASMPKPQHKRDIRRPNRSLETRTVRHHMVGIRPHETLHRRLFRLPYERRLHPLSFPLPSPRSVRPQRFNPASQNHKKQASSNRPEYSRPCLLRDL